MRKGFLSLAIFLCFYWYNQLVDEIFLVVYNVLHGDNSKAEGYVFEHEKGLYQIETTNDFFETTPL